MRRNLPSPSRPRTAAITFTLASIALLGAALPLHAKDMAILPALTVEIVNEGPGGGEEIIDIGNPLIGRPYYSYSDDMLRSHVIETLQRSRTAGRDVWAWRDQVEEQLVSLGPAAAPFMLELLAQRDGYERDALQVAIFRLQNQPLRPNEMLTAWASRFFGLSSGDSPPYKITRVLDVRDVVDLRLLFPHHLFYAIDYPARNARVLVALAADGMVQPLPDDAALARFIRNEAALQSTQVGKERLAAAAALISVARTTTVYKPDRLRVDGQLPTFTITLDAGAVHQTLTATFEPSGLLQTLVSGQQTSQTRPAVPPPVPTVVKPPPAMPD